MFSRIYADTAGTRDMGFTVFYVTQKSLPKWSFRLGACGGTITTPQGILTSPSYPDNYSNDVECIYTISRPNMTYINLTISYFDTHCTDNLEMRDGRFESSPKMASFCGDGNVIPPYLLTSKNHLRIRYIMVSALLSMQLETENDIRYVDNTEMKYTFTCLADSHQTT